MSQFQDTDEFLELKLNFAVHVIQKLDEIEQLILSLENEKNQDALKSISRRLLAEFHSIKGSSGALVFESIKIICHKVEDIVLTEGIVGLNDKVEILLVYKDAIKNYFESFVKDKKIDEEIFVKNHSNIFENIVHEQVQSNKTLQSRLGLNVLVVGLPQIIVKKLVKSAEGFDLRLSYAANSVNAIERIAKEKYHLVLVSYFIEPINGLSLCASLKIQWPKSDLKFILFPSQEVEFFSSEEFKKISPDKIILKTQNMYSEFSDYLSSTFKQNRNVKKVAFLDDEINILDLYKITFEDLNEIEKIFIVPNENIEDDLVKFKPDLIISDINMPNVDVVQLLESFLKKEEIRPDFIFITGDLNGEKSKKLLESGARAVFEKNIITFDLIPQCEKLGFEFKGKK